MRAGVVGAPVHYVSDEIRRVRGILGIGAVLLAVLAVACGDGGPVAPTTPTPVSAPLSDSWLGWFTSVSTGHKTATMTLFHVGSVVTGFLTLSASFTVWTGPSTTAAQAFAGVDVTIWRWSGTAWELYAGALPEALRVNYALEPMNVLYNAGAAVTVEA